MERLDYDTDPRWPGSEHMRRAFRGGWKRGASNDDRLKDPSRLDRLTWWNLGYRMGTLLKKAPNEVIDVMYALCDTVQRWKAVEAEPAASLEEDPELERNAPEQDTDR